MKRLALLLLLVLAPTAQAFPYEKQTQRFWHNQVPPCGSVFVQYVDEIPGYSEAWAGSYPWTCVIQLDNDYFVHAHKTRRLRRLLCTSLVHEYGHLLYGYEHSSDPHNIMYASPLAPPVCMRLK